MRIDSERILKHTSPSARAVILYGSRARGDSRPDSDTDVLQIFSTTQTSHIVEEIALSCYTLPQLQKMAHHGSLFVAHVISEGVALRDPEGLLDVLRASYRPASYAHFVSEVTWSARLLTDSAVVFAQRPLKYERLALHLARTYIYATAQCRDVRTFALEAIWRRFQDQWGSPLPRFEQMTWETYIETRGWIRDRLARDITNEFGTPEALIVNAWGNSRLCVALGLRLLHDGDTLPAYEDTDLWGETW